MKSLIPLFLLAFLFSFIDAKAQQPHFIYIQTENKQPFYVRMDKTIYNSTESGYVIISKLLDSTYNLTVGFLKNEWPQQNYSCTINKKDEGFVLKNFGDKGWALFNLETMNVLMANMPVEDKNIMKEERTDSFSNMLSAVVHDPGIKQKLIVKSYVSKDSVGINVDTLKNQVAVSNLPTNTITKPAIIKISQTVNTDGIELIYLDNANDGKDTIRLIIPVDKPIVTDEQKVTEKTIPDTTKKQPSAIEEKKDVAIVNNADTTPKIITVPKGKLDTITPAVKSIEKAASDKGSEKTTATANSNGCTNLATDDDFLKLRKKMASADTDDEMIGIAKKAFKLKCFATKQIRNLGFLFLKDEGRYKFFDMAYSFVSDPENFDSLQSEFTDEYYINRFKIMVKH